MPKYKSDARPSDTKSVVLHRENDARLLEHLRSTKRESAFWRQAAYFYLDFMAWLSTQPDPPAPNLPFIHYRQWLENPPLSLGERGPEGEVDPAALAAELLPGVRNIIDAALAGLSLTGSAPLAGEPVTLELADLFSPELVLE